jgi:hypothetical protein
VIAAPPGAIIQREAAMVIEIGGYVEPGSPT